MATRVLQVSPKSSLGEAAALAVQAALLRRASRRLTRGRRAPGPDYLYEAYWAVVQEVGPGGSLLARPETLERLRAALRRAHA